MTTRKSDLRLPTRTPAYVTREIGAAELSISPATWDDWVEAGRLPPPAPGFPASAPRWRWSDVDRLLSGRPAGGRGLACDGEPDEADETPAVDLGAERAAFLRDGPSSRRRHPSPAGRAPRPV